MSKKVYGQKNVQTTHLTDYTEEQAQQMGKIFFTAWSDFQVKRKEKHRKKIKKVLDSKLKK